MAVCAFGLALGSAKAQKVVKDNVDGTQQTTETKTTPENGNAEGSDLNIDYSSETKTLGLGIATDMSKNTYWGMNISMGFGDLSSYGYTLQFGLKKRYVFNDMFLIQGKIGPYAGFYSYDTKEHKYDKYGKVKSTETKTNYEFTWGANGSLAAGIKIWNTKKGNSTFLTVGYYINARELKTEKLIENGSWGFGITKIFN